MFLRFVLAMGVLLMLAAGCGGSEPDLDVPARIQTPVGQVETSNQIDEILGAHVTGDAPGAAVIVVQGGQVLHKAGYGLADIEGGVPIRPETLFHLGSVGKQFTALAVMMLAKEGELGYDDPISEHLPELSRFGDSLTIRHLLHHTSGIADYYEDRDLYEKLLDRAEMPTNEDALALLSEVNVPRSEPGAEFSYSNTGYEVLGTLIERVSGQSYAAFVQERIFDPLDMASTFSLPDADRRADPNVAHSYIREDGQVEPYDWDPLDNLVGSGSFYSTIEDMARYDAALYTERLAPWSTLAEAFEPATLNDGSESDYGFGWGLGTRGGESYVAHGGSWLGFTSYYLRFPDQRLAVVILANRDYELPLEEMAFEIADLYLR